MACFLSRSKHNDNNVRTRAYKNGGKIVDALSIVLYCISILYVRLIPIGSQL